MASRRLLGAVARHFRFSNHSISSLQNFGTLILRSKLVHFYQCPPSNAFAALASTDVLRRFSSRTPAYSGSEDDDEEEDDDDAGKLEGSCDEEDGSEMGPKLVLHSGKSEAEKVDEAASIGYKVIGPLTASENPFKLYEPVFAVVQVDIGLTLFFQKISTC